MVSALQLRLAMLLLVFAFVAVHTSFSAAVGIMDIVAPIVQLVDA